MTLDTRAFAALPQSSSFELADSDVILQASEMFGNTLVYSSPSVVVLLISSPQSLFMAQSPPSFSYFFSATPLRLCRLWCVFCGVEVLSSFSSFVLTCSTFAHFLVTFWVVFPGSSHFGFQLLHRDNFRCCSSLVYSFFYR